MQVPPLTSFGRDDKGEMVGETWGGVWRL